MRLLISDDDDDDGGDMMIINTTNRQNGIKIEEKLCIHRFVPHFSGTVSCKNENRRVHASLTRIRFTR